MPITVRMTLLPHAQDLPLPTVADPNGGGLDLIAVVPANAPIALASGGRAAIPTGLTITLPPNTEAQIRPHVGLALHHGVIPLNTTFNANYRRELHVILANLGTEPFTVARGDRIALLVIAPVAVVDIEWPG